MSAFAPTPFDTRLEQEGRALIEQAATAGLGARLMGGVGIRLLLGDRYPAALERRYGDLDVLIRKRDRRPFEQLVVERGWAPAVAFNALNGDRRMLFVDPLSDAQIDVFVEAFEMCHTLPLADGLSEAGPYSLQACDLLMSKLQIVSLNVKDRNDCYALMIGCSRGRAPYEVLDVHRIAAVTAADWGMHHTFERNLDVLAEHLGAVALGAAEVDAVRASLDAVRGAMDEAPKSRAWRLRAKVGERRRWYDEPEEVEREASP